MKRVLNRFGLKRNGANLYMICKECIVYGWLTFGTVIGATLGFYLYLYYSFSRVIFLKHSDDLKKAEQSEINRAVNKAKASLSNPFDEYNRRKAKFRL